LDYLSEIAGRRVYYLTALAIIAMVFVSTVVLTRPPLTSLTNSATKTIQVTGTGTVSASPDQAILDLAVQTQAATATQTTSDNAVAMANVITALTRAGIGNNSIQTVSYTLTPTYSNPVNQSVPPTIIGYIAVNAIQVTVNDLGSIGKILDQAISAGANEVEGVSFTLSSSTLATIQRQALQLALTDADGQAKAMATTLGVTIVGPISVTPGYEFQPTNYSRLAATAETPIQSGTLQVTATAQVTYAFT
jgi:hypothetical protein